MTQDQIYDIMQSERRNGADPLAALHTAMKKAGADMLPFYSGDKMLYIRCDGVPSSNIKTIDFLVYGINHSWKIQVLPVDVIEGEKVSAAYINIFKETK